MEKSGILKTPNGHLEYYISTDKKYDGMFIKTETNDGKLLLKLDRFDVFNLFQICQEYVQEIQMKNSIPDTMDCESK